MKVLFRDFLTHDSLVSMQNRNPELQNHLDLRVTLPNRREPIRLLPGPVNPELENDSRTYTVHSAIIFPDLQCLDHLSKISETSVSPSGSFALMFAGLVGEWCQREPPKNWQGPSEGNGDSSCKELSRALNQMVSGPRRSQRNQRGTKRNFRVMLHFGLVAFASRMDRLGSRKFVILLSTFEALHHKFTFLSVLGGAYSTLGRNNKAHAKRAGELARQMSLLACKLGDQEMELKCEIYFSEALIQIGSLRPAQRIVDKQLLVAHSLNNEALVSICLSAQSKLLAARARTRKPLPRNPPKTQTVD